ncbi:MAG: polysaccharide deacetylase [Bacteroidetes bacterium]|nr:MAG: polysaccharide deacetylase [Bacteroidota bacterium]
MHSVRIFFFLLISLPSFAQNDRRVVDSLVLEHPNSTQKVEKKRVAITIDDVPNTRSFEENGYQSKLLHLLDSAKVPVTIFINEGKLDYGKKRKNVKLLEDWIERPFVTPANHTFGHSRYSAVGFDEFVEDIENGEELTASLAAKHNKNLRYFRFPYNDLGKDSAQQVQMQKFLSDNHYISTPFTIETSDWMFSAVYDRYLEKGDKEKAKEIGRMYVAETIRTFAFFDSLMRHQYGRSVNQIYLCHDNKLNEDYLSELLLGLEMEGYAFIDLDEAMRDEVYHQEDNYWKKWGISWCYRWMKPSERRSTMMKEPNLGGIEDRYHKEMEEK